MTWSGHRLLAAVVAAGALLTLSACGEQETPSAGGGTAQGGEEGCPPSAQGQQRYEQAWKSGTSALGLKDVEPAPMEICEVDTAAYKKPEPGGGYRIALAAQGPTNSWALTNEEAFKFRAEERGAKVLYASANGDATKQVDNIQQLASQRPDAMVVVPMGPGITGQVRAAAQQDIPVVLCAGTLPANSGAISTVTRQYELQGSLGAEWLAQKLGGKGRIAMLSGIAGVPTAEEQKKAATKVFEKYPGIEIVAQEYTGWSPTKAKTVAASLVGRDLDAIWSDSAISDLGVLEAYEAAGKKVPPLTGDSSNAFLKAAKGSDVEFALSAFPPEMSTQCLDTALDAVTGKAVPSFVNIESAVFTHENADEFLREDCTENLWVPSKLPEEFLERLELC